MQEPKLDSVAVAKHIAYLCYENGYDCNHTKIQKLLYICYGAFLAEYNVKLVDEQPQAWQYGPVFPEVFRYIAKSGQDYAEKMNINDEKIAKDICQIVKCFGIYPAGKLSAWSHITGSPWDQVVMKDKPEWGVPIPDKIIKEYFVAKVIKHD